MTAPTSFTFHITGYDGTPYTLIPQATRYLDNLRPAVQLVDANTNECWGMLSTNLSDAWLYEPETSIAINHDLSESTVNALIKAGFLEDEPIQRIPSEFVDFSVYQFTKAGYEWFHDAVEVKEPAMF